MCSGIQSETQLNDMLQEYTDVFRHTERNPAERHATGVY